MNILFTLCLRLAGTALRIAAQVADPGIVERRAVQRAEWRRVAAGDGLPPKVKKYLEGL